MPHFIRQYGINAVNGQITGGPRSHDTVQPPNYWYLGDFADDEFEDCERECALIAECYVRRPSLYVYAHSLAIRFQYTQYIVHLL